MKEKVIAYLNENYTEDKLTAQLDEEILEWVDDDWEEEFENEYDWYRDYGHGEAEDAIRTQIDNAVMKKFGITYDEYEKEAGEPLWETITNLFEFLQTI